MTYLQQGPQTIAYTRFLIYNIDMKKAFYTLSLFLSALLAVPAFAAKNSANVKPANSVADSSVVGSVLPNFQLDENWLDFVQSPVFEVSGPIEESQPLTRGAYPQDLKQYSFWYLNDINKKVISGAAKTVDVAMYSINIADNVNDLIEAANRGVKIRLLMDEKHCYPSLHKEVKRLLEVPGVQFKTIRGYGDWGVNHNKIVISDREIVTAGSYNWTFSATYQNLENSVVLRDPRYVQGYVSYFDWMWERGRALQASQPGPVAPGTYGIPPQAPVIATFNGVDVPAFIFSPGSRSEERLAALIDAAQISVDACTFSFSSNILADALIRAHKRGVKVRFMMDQKIAQTSYTARYLYQSGTDFKVRAGRKGKGALHNKFIIIDGKVMQTGSFNWAQNASVNSFENMVFFVDAYHIKGYQNTYDTLYAETVTVGPDHFSALDQQ